MTFWKRLDKAVFGALISALGGYTYEEMVGVEQFYITERDKDRQEREALQEELAKIRSDIKDLNDRKLIAQSIPDEDWTPAAMKHAMDGMAMQLAQLTADAERRRKRASERARAMPRDATGRFLK